jgi:hypothetical protein
MRHTSPFTRRLSARCLTMHVSRSLRLRMRDRPGHGTVPQLVTGLRRPIRHVSVPRSVVCPVQLRSLCVTEALGSGRAGFQGMPDRPCAFDVPPAIHRWHGRQCGTINPRLASGLQRLTGAPEPFAAPRRTIFCTGPGMELCVVSPCRQHRPRLDASPCVVADAGRDDSRTVRKAVENMA